MKNINGVEINYRKIDRKEEIRGESPWAIEDLLSYLHQFKMRKTEVICIDSIIVDRDKRRKGLATEAVKEFAKEYDKSIIVALSSVLKSEYPEEPSPEELQNILNDLDKFYGREDFFVNMTLYLGQYETKDVYIYSNEIGKQIINKIINYQNNILSEKE